MLNQQTIPSPGVRPLPGPTTRRVVDRGNAPTLTEAVIGRLRADILSGRLAPGERLRLQLLRERYGVGGSPLREALSQLVADELVTVQRQCGFAVAPISRAEFEDLARLRVELEATALRLTMEAGGPAWRDRLARQLTLFIEAHPKVGDPRPIDEAWEAAHRSFHFALIDGCGSPILLRFLRQLHDRFDRYRRLALPTISYIAGISDEHQHLVTAATSGDATRATRILTSHIQEAADLIRGNFDEFCGTASGQDTHRLACRNTSSEHIPASTEASGCIA